MKKSVYMFLLVGSLLIGANVVSVADGAKKNKAKKYVSCTDQTSQIKELIGNADLSLKESSSVKILFNISEENIISVTDVKTDNAKLKEFVFQKLDGRKINGNDVEMKNQSLKLVFQNQEDESFVVYQ